MASLDDKKSFLAWVVEHVTFKEKEAYWILNYLLNHEGILNRVIFVEHAEKTPRGLVLSDGESDKDGLTLYKNNHMFSDAQQIFHDIRMCYKDSLYFDICFTKRELNQLYLTVLEDNPHVSVFETISPKMREQLDIYLEQHKKDFELRMIQKEIDRAIDECDETSFVNWSNEYNLKKNQQ